MTIDASRKPSKTINNPTSKFEKVYIPDISAGLARSHNIIRLERSKEIQFMKICSQIHLDDFKEKRSEDQRNDSKLKRLDKHRKIVNA